MFLSNPLVLKGPIQRKRPRWYMPIPLLNVVSLVSPLALPLRQATMLWCLQGPPLGEAEDDGVLMGLLVKLDLFRRVWAVDFFGQGMSLPMEDPAPLPMEEDLSKGKAFAWGFGDKTEPWANELVYIVDRWKDQVLFFIEQVIGE
ncbi:hypothetical protein Nepgr_008410 [Nepenthes gracilis]|uniref:Uncharacterized protein n=1 Tax=Nepenthes gracilis TaxID=150966 RepID=A0AAD3XJC7_NEPGR|nr:hypothetical protein Nepgr_008410 [Nepenthes gracilis]